MQNTVALGALVFLLGLEFEVTASVLADTFKHKGEGVIDQNVGVAKAGYDYAREHFVPLGYQVEVLPQAPAVTSPGTKPSRSARSRRDAASTPPIP